MSEIQHFTIPGRLPGYNQLNSGHWAKRNKIKQEAMDLVGWYIKRSKLKLIQSKAIIEIRCYEPNAMRDCDNVTSGASKVILDSLKNQGIIQDDSRKYVRCIKHPAEVDRKNPRIEVSITIC